MMTNAEFVAILEKILNEKTVYMWGTYGQKVTAELINNKRAQYPARYTVRRVELLKQHVGEYAADCCGLIKGVLWGWNPPEKPIYRANGVPDVTASGLINSCKVTSTDFSGELTPGEIVYKTGHVGVYVGGGDVIEATLAGTRDGVVKTKLADGGWNKHGFLPWLEYNKEETVCDRCLIAARDCINGKYGNGAARKIALRRAGFEPAIVQALVNAILRGDLK